MKFEYKNTDSNYLYKQFKDIADDMMIQFKRLKRDKATNKTDEGEFLEKLLLSFLVSYLPKKASVGRGYVMNSEGHRSLQQDIVIYDPNNYVLLRDTEGFQVFPVECVHATIEVKSTLTKEVIRQVNENIKSIKGLSHHKTWYKKDTGEITKTSFHGSTIFSSVFAFQATSKLSTCADNIDEINEAIDYVYILNKGIIFYVAKKINLPNGQAAIEHTTTPKIGEAEIGWINPEKASVSAFPLFSLLSSILSHIEDHGDKKGDFSLAEYVKITDSFIVSTKTEKRS